MDSTSRASRFPCPPMKSWNAVHREYPERSILLSMARDAKRASLVRRKNLAEGQSLHAARNALSRAPTRIATSQKQPTQYVELSSESVTVPFRVACRCAMNRAGIDTACCRDGLRSHIAAPWANTGQFSGIKMWRLSRVASAQLMAHLTTGITPQMTLMTHVVTVVESLQDRLKRWGS